MYVFPFFLCLSFVLFFVFSFVALSLIEQDGGERGALL